MRKAEELLLHIGHEKTGTTTLQYAMMQARHILREQGVLFPEMHPNTGNAVLLAHSLFGHGEIDQRRQRWLKKGADEIRADADLAWERIVEEIASRPPKTLFLTSEIFYRPMSSAAIKFANQRLHEVAETSRIVAYVRAPDAYFLSQMQQVLKEYSLDFRRSRTRNRDTLLPLIKNWDGPLSLRAFERGALIDGDIVTDFLTNFLPDIDAASIERKFPSLNATHSSEAMAILHDLTTGVLDWRGERYALSVEVLKFDKRLENPTRPTLQQSLKDTLVNWHAPDLFWLRDEHGITFSSIDYDAIDENEVDEGAMKFAGIEDICPVNPERKAELFRRAARRARVPKKIRHLIYNYP